LEGGFAIVRSPDQYDSGEVERRVHLDQLHLVQSTHTFYHRSMYGTYETECLAVPDGPGVSKIWYIDPIEGTPETNTIQNEELIGPTLEDRDLERLMRFYGVQTKEDLILEMERHILKLQAKLPKMKLAAPTFQRR
jgi:hypothetical protein